MGTASWKDVTVGTLGSMRTRLAISCSGVPLNWRTRSAARYASRRIGPSEGALWRPLSDSPSAPSSTSRRNCSNAVSRCAANNSPGSWREGCCQEGWNGKMTPPSGDSIHCTFGLRCGFTSSAVGSFSTMVDSESANCCQMNAGRFSMFKLCRWGPLMLP
eukprot:6565394-Prymnesium_polylepis.1